MRQTILLRVKILQTYLSKGGAFLNIVTSSSRCALPYDSSYHASKAALWALSETLEREYENAFICTYVPSHMPTQTAMSVGRRALGVFRYRDEKTKTPADVAKHVIQILLQKKSYFISWKNRLKLACNQLFPRWISKKIQKAKLSKNTKSGCS